MVGDVFMESEDEFVVGVLLLSGVGSNGVMCGKEGEMGWESGVKLKGEEGGIGPGERGDGKMGK